MRIQIVMHLVGQLILIVAAIMVIPFIYSLLWETPAISFLACALLGAAIGGGLLYFGRPSTAYSLRDGFLTVSSTWILASLLAALPFYFGGILPDPADALFEAVSGITATGASVIPDVDSIPKSYVLWRGLTHWLGGMGIIVLVLAFLKNLGADSAHLFNAEASVPRPGVVMPRIKSIAMKLWKIYLLFTIVCGLALWAAGMSFFDAVNYTFSTIATGGYTPNAAGDGANGLIFIYLLWRLQWFHHRWHQDYSYHHLGEEQHYLSEKSHPSGYGTKRARQRQADATKMGANCPAIFLPIHDGLRHFVHLHCCHGSLRW